MPPPIDWDSIDAAFGAPKQRQQQPSPAPNPFAFPADGKVTVPNGLLSLTFPCGTVKRFRVHTRRPDSDFMPGKRLLALLVGPPGSDEYEDVGLVGERGGVAVWKSHRGGRVERYADLLWRLCRGEEVAGHVLTVERRCCLACNRPLTDELSLERNMGEECWGRRLQGGG